MRLLKSLLLSAFGMGVRFVAALLAFTIVARVLGPSGFGVLMLCMSMAALLALLSNFGLVTLLLREIGVDAASAPQILARALGAKLLISALALLLGLTLLPWLAPAARLPYGLLLLALLIESFAEFFSAGFRARQRFDIDARLALQTALIQLLGVGLAAWFGASLLWIATAYLLTRGISAVLTWQQLRRLIGPLPSSSVGAAMQQLGAARSYALDAMLTSAFGQVDSLVLNHFLGPVAVGLHQAGMRIFMTGTQAAAVLANVFLPRAAAAQAQRDDALGAEHLRLQLAFLAVGAGFGLLLALAGDWLVRQLFGSAFAALGALMPCFGLLFALKFIAAAWGVVLTAAGLQGYRAFVSALHWALIAGLAWFWVPMHGNPGWLWALIAGTALQALLYALRAFRADRSNLLVLGLTLLLLLAFMPLLGLS